MRLAADLIPRIAVAITAVPLVLATVLWAPAWGVAAMAGAVAAVAAGELAALGRIAGISRVAPAVAAASIPLAAQVVGGLPPSPQAGQASAVAFGVILGIIVARRVVTASPTSVLASIAGALYCGLPLACVVALREAAPGWALLALAVTWGGDIAGYFVGTAFGRVPLAHRLSPRKTVEGAIASLGFAVALAVPLAPGLVGRNLAGVIALALGGSILAQAGDLFESSLKRSRGVKDSGTLIPAHGGMMDVLDGLCFAGPWLYVGRGLFL